MLLVPEVFSHDHVMVNRCIWQGKQDGVHLKQGGAVCVRLSFQNCTFIAVTETVKIINNYYKTSNLLNAITGDNCHVSDEDSVVPDACTFEQSYQSYTV